MQKSLDIDKKEAFRRSRGRPRVFDRTIALAKATHLFWEKGFHATSISDLTRAMDIGSPSLYAAFGSKEALYAEALEFYRDTYEGFIWDGFFSARTAREAIERYLMDSAAALSGSVLETPRGCMVTLSSVGSEGYPELGELVRAGRTGTRIRLEERLRRAVKENEVSQAVDVPTLASTCKQCRAAWPCSPKMVLVAWILKQWPKLRCWHAIRDSVRQGPSLQARGIAKSLVEPSRLVCSQVNELA